MDSKFKRSVLLESSKFCAYIHSLGRSRDQRYRSSNICTLRNHQLGKNWNPWAVICELIKLSCQASKDHPRISCFQWKNVPWYVIILKGLLILKCPFGVFKSPKNQRNFFQDFCHSSSKKRSNQKNSSVRVGLCKRVKIKSSN